MKTAIVALYVQNPFSIQQLCDFILENTTVKVPSKIILLAMFVVRSFVYDFSLKAHMKIHSVGSKISENKFSTPTTSAHTKLKPHVGALAAGISQESARKKSIVQSGNKTAPKEKKQSKRIENEKLFGELSMAAKPLFSCSLCKFC